MKETMLGQVLLVLVALTAVNASGDFVVLHSPESVVFSGKEALDQSLLKEVYAATLGFTVKQRGTWNGLSITNPFTLPEAVVNIAVEGVDSLDSPRGEKFPLNVDEVEETTWQALSGRLAERNNDNTLVRIYLGDGLDALGQSALGELKPTLIDQSSLKALKLDIEEDKKLLDEVQLLHAIAKKVPSAVKANTNPGVYWLVVSGLRPVLDLHGKNSAAAKEALSLLNNAFNEISEAFVNAYEGKVLVTAFTNDASQVRRTRSIILERDIRAADSDNNENVDTTAPTETNTELNNIENVKQGDNEESKKNADGKEEEDTDTLNSVAGESSNIATTEQNSETTEKFIDNTAEKGYEINTDKQGLGQGSSQFNLAPSYNDTYPAIFNIILWFGVVFFFSLLAICITIAEMDPGRDSIIYRMTSNRMKKDN